MAVQELRRGFCRGTIPESRYPADHRPDAQGRDAGTGDSRDSEVVLFPADGSIYEEEN